MKVKVIIGFIDKTTGLKVSPNDILEVSEERANELVSRGKVIITEKNEVKPEVEKNEMKPKKEKKKKNE